jgi:hypothetical protein
MKLHSGRKLFGQFFSWCSRKKFHPKVKGKKFMDTIGGFVGAKKQHNQIVRYKYT